MPGILSWWKKLFGGKKEKREDVVQRKIHSAPVKSQTPQAPLKERPNTSPVVKSKDAPALRKNESQEKSDPERGSRTPNAPHNSEELVKLQNDLGAVYSSKDVERLFSSKWDVRCEAAKTVAETLSDEKVSCGDEEQVFRLTCQFLQHFLHDRVAPVYFSGLDVLRALMEHYTAEVQRIDMLDECAVIVPLLVSRIGDSNSRVHEASCQAIMFMARLQTIGPEAVLPHCVVPFPGLKKTRHIRGRLLLLRKCVPEFGFASSGLSCERVMALVRPTLDISDEKVRQAGVSVVVEAYKLNAKVTRRHLREINPLLKKMIEERFAAVDGVTVDISGEAAAKRKKEGPPRSSSTRKSKRAMPGSLNKTPSSSRLTDPMCSPTAPPKPPRVPLPTDDASGTEPQAIKRKLSTEDDALTPARRVSRRSLPPLKASSPSAKTLDAPSAHPLAPGSVLPAASDEDFLDDILSATSHLPEHRPSLSGLSMSTGSLMSSPRSLPGYSSREDPEALIMLDQ
eukprot:Rmarinus@m.27652